MAKPIKETPFLTGRDAEIFIEDNKLVEKASCEEKEEINESYENLKSIATFEI